MTQIPIYLKTDDHMPRPQDPVYYLITRNGTFLCRNHEFFASDVRTAQGPSGLAWHNEACWVRYPKLGRAALELAVGFFDRVYREHGAEAVVLLYWNLRRRRYKLWVPEQSPTVWQSFSGYRTPMDVTYEVPLRGPQDCLLVGDIHSHADLDAYASHQDRSDERYRDGVHIVVGRIDQEPPQFHLEVAVDGQRFLLRFEQFLRGYQRRRQLVPQAWMDQIHVTVKRSWGSSWGATGTPYQYSSTDADYGDYSQGNWQSNQSSWPNDSPSLDFLPDQSSADPQRPDDDRDWRA